MCGNSRVDQREYKQKFLKAAVDLSEDYEVEIRKEGKELEVRVSEPHTVRVR